MIESRHLHVLNQFKLSEARPVRDIIKCLPLKVMTFSFIQEKAETRHQKLLITGLRRLNQGQFKTQQTAFPHPETDILETRGLKPFFQLRLCRIRHRKHQSNA